MKHKYYKDKPGYYKYMLVFKSKFFYGRTIITMDATDEARALAEKYFGPPASIPNVVSVDQDKQ